MKMNELMVFIGNTVSIEKYDSIGKNSLAISEVWKTEKSKEESIASSREKEQEQASSHTTTTPTQSSTDDP